MAKTLSRLRAAAGAMVSRLSGHRHPVRSTRPRVVYRPQPLQRWGP